MTAAQLAVHREMHSLYQAHYSWLQSWLRKRLGNASDAADLAQETFIKVMTAAGARTEILAPRPFLATVARRLMAHQYRRHLLETSYRGMLTHLPEELTPSPEVRLLALEALSQVDRALRRLPPRVQKAFLLAHLEDLGYADIAARLDVSTSSVKQYLTRANRQCGFALVT